MTHGRWRRLAEEVGATCQRALPDLRGVYVHGSAALGGFATGSDLDMLVVSSSPAGTSRLAAELLTFAGKGPPLELSVVSIEAAETPARPWPFLLHVDSAHQRLVHDDGVGDPDLLAHYAVTRTHGIAIRGPAPVDLIGPVRREDLLDYLAGELRWGLDHADQRYAVLNACRASAFAATGALLSKVDGAHWWARSRGPSDVVDRCLAAQRRGIDLGPCDGEGRRLVVHAMRELGSRPANKGARVLPPRAQDVDPPRIARDHEQSS